MGTRKRRFMPYVLLAAILLLTTMIILWQRPVGSPAALIRVQDEAGNPVAGAMIMPISMRAKPGPYEHTSYAVPEAYRKLSEKTDERMGATLVPYPKFATEGIETGSLHFSVKHPDYVPHSVELVVSTAPPGGAPMQEWFDELKKRLQRHEVITKPPPVTIKRGAIVRVTAQADPVLDGDGILHVQSSWGGTWNQVARGAAETHQAAAGYQTLRAIQFDAGGTPWFSDPQSVKLTSGVTNELAVKLKRGVRLEGRLGDMVPRPISRGRVVVKIVPIPAVSPNEIFWQAWTEVDAEGAFSIDGLPGGELCLTALCDGFVSTNGPSRIIGSSRLPQRFALNSPGLNVTVGMEPTVRLEVTVTNAAGKVVPGVRMYTIPNVRYDGVGSTVFLGDRYNLGEVLRDRSNSVSRLNPPADIEGTSDEQGVAVFANLPTNVRELRLHPGAYELPTSVERFTGALDRVVQFNLSSGVTNRIRILVEPKNTTRISHY